MTAKRFFGNTKTLHSILDLKAAFVTSWFHPIDGNMFNTRPHWATIEISQIGIYGFPVPLDFRFNTTIHHIPHPPSQPMVFGLPTHKCPIPNPLNDTTDEHMRSNNFV